MPDINTNATVPGCFSSSLSLGFSPHMIHFTAFFGKTATADEFAVAFFAPPQYWLLPCYAWFVDLPSFKSYDGWIMTSTFVAATQLLYNTVFEKP